MQKGKKDKADDGDDRPASELARDATEGVAASAAPNGTLHADGGFHCVIQLARILAG